MAATVAIVAIFLGLPISILLYRDALQAAANTGSTRTTAILSLPIRMLGGVSFAAGFAILVWVIYNVFVERQPQFTGVRTLGQLVLPVLLMVFGYYWMRRPVERTDDEDEAA